MFIRESLPKCGPAYIGERNHRRQTCAPQIGEGSTLVTCLCTCEKSQNNEFKLRPQSSNYHTVTHVASWMCRAQKRQRTCTLTEEKPKLRSLHLKSPQCAHTQSLTHRHTVTHTHRKHKQTYSVTFTHAYTLT